MKRINLQSATCKDKSAFVKGIRENIHFKVNEINLRQVSVCVSEKTVCKFMTRAETFIAHLFIYLKKKNRSLLPDFLQTSTIITGVMVELRMYVMCAMYVDLAMAGRPQSRVLYGL